jgi:short-subunit dehydrogenase
MTDIVVMTGSTGGIGQIVYAYLKAKGFEVLKLSRRPKPDNETYFIDLSSVRDMERACNFVRTMQPVGLINCAGIQGDFTDTGKNISTVMQVNCISPVMLMNAIIPTMKQPGFIINFAGGGAASTRPFMTPYAMSKAALVRATECIAGEVESKGYKIKVNCIAPGAYPTRMTDEVIDAGPGVVGFDEFNSAKKTKEHDAVTTMKLANNILNLVEYMMQPSCPFNGKLISVKEDYRDYEYINPNELVLRRTNYHE